VGNFFGSTTQVMLRPKCLAKKTLIFNMLRSSKNPLSITCVALPFVVRSDQNQLINVYAASLFSQAFDIVGNHNLLINSIAQCFVLRFGGCITVRGDGNRLIDNFATSTNITTFTDPGGFEISGNNNVLQGNRAIRNEGPGIVVTGTGNRLTRNTALLNSLDLQDTSGDCAHNTWRQNTFATSDPACIGQSAGESVVELVR
jgi:parallel beta-helix repeat protein